MAKTVEQIVAELSAPFPPEQIEWRVGPTNADKTKGIALAYLTSRMVMDRLDEVVGPFNWQINHVAADGGKVTASISIRNPETGEWVAKSDGAGQTDVEGDKGSYSDSTKRAAVLWGVGRYLYALESPWVAISASGRGYRIADHEYEGLYRLLPGEHTNVQVHGVTGLSKEPAKFWSSPSFNVLAQTPKKYQNGHGDPNWGDPDAVVWACGHIRKAIEKAPNAMALTKLQVDNLTWINSCIPQPDKDAIMQNFVIRREQFDQKGKP